MSTANNLIRICLAVFFVAAATNARADLGLTNGSKLFFLSGANNAELRYHIVVPSGATKLEVKTTGGSGNCDLYVKLGAQPTTAIWDGRGITSSTVETVTVINPAAGTWNILVRGAGAPGFSSVTLTTNLTTNAPAITTQPLNKTVLIGQTATFTVTTTGTPSPTYQWKRAAVVLTNGGNISGATTNTLTITNAQASDAGSYSVVATNPSGFTTSNAATLVVNPIIPVNHTFEGRLPYSGASVTGTNVNVTSDNSLDGLWWSWVSPVTGSVSITTQGSSIDTILKVYTGASSASLSLVTSNDDADGTVTSRVALQAVAGTTYQIWVGGFRHQEGAVALSVVTAPPANDNFANRALLVGATVTTTASNVTATAQAGEQTIGGYAAAKSLWWSWQAPATGPVTVNTNGSFFDTVLSVYTGSVLGSLTQVAADDGHGEDGGRGGYYGTSSLSFAATAGTTYLIAVDGRFGDSGTIALQVKPTTVPVIAAQPAGLGVFTGGQASFSVATTGPNPVYQWKKNGGNVSNAATVNGTSSATLATLLLNNVQPADGGAYTVVITNAAGSVTSNAATLTVNPVGFPTITAISAPRQVVNLGQNLTLSVTATGAPTPTYQWKRNGRAIPGATSATYPIIASTARDNGWYQVVVTNSFGSVTSAVVFVNVAVNQAQVVAWGNNSEGKTSVPAGLTNVVSVAANLINSVALKADGTVVVWGDNRFGQQTVPVQATNIVAIAASGWRIIALRSDGKLVTWGDQLRNRFGVVIATPIDSNFVGIAAGGSHMVALRSDGTVTAWGYDEGGADYRLVVNDLTNVSSVAAGDSHTLAVNADGTIVVRGASVYGPGPVPKVLLNAATANVVAVTGGWPHSVALKSDGTATAWGSDSYMYAEVLRVPPGLDTVVGVSARSDYTLALKANGSVVAWGNNYYSGVASVPSGLANVVSVAAGGYHNVVLRNATSGNYTVPVITTQPGDNGVTAGQSLSFSAIGSGFSSYQWYVDGVPLSEGEQPSGAVVTGASGSGISAPSDTVVTVTINNTQESDQANYSVVLTNDASGSSVNSTPAFMTVNDPFAPDQVISFADLADAIIGSSITLVASASSGLPITFSLIEGSAVLSGAGNNILTLTGLGKVTVRATQGGGTNSNSDFYNPATPTDRSFFVIKNSQAAPVITSGSSFTFGGTYTATANTGVGALSWALGNGSTASGAAINTTTGAVTATSAGTVVIKVQFAGNSTYDMSPFSSDFPVTVNKANQTTVSITSAASTTLGAAYAATASGGSGTGALVWALGVGSTAPGAAISASTGAVNSTGIGTVVFHVTRAGDTNYNASATTADFTLTVIAPSLAVKSDFNGDGKADLFVQNTVTGARELWLMNGATKLGAVTFTIPAEWTIAGTGDFNADGKQDVLWQNRATGDILIWVMDGLYPYAAIWLGIIPPEFEIVGIADFNADSKPDLLWQNNVTGDRLVWLMDGFYPYLGVGLGNIPVEWDIAGVGDFNADTKPDLVWQNKTTGDRLIWLMDGLYPSVGVGLGNIPVEWEITAIGDYNGDSKSDLVWQNKNTGVRLVWFMNGTASSGSAGLPALTTDWQIRN